MPETKRPRSVFGHSLWLIPSGQVCESLGQWIEDLAAEFNGPVFPPHVTLAGEIQGDLASLVHGAEELCRGLPLCLTLESADFGQDYYQGLFLPVQASASLAQLRSRAETLFLLPRGQPYCPHLSLWYGFASREKKQRMAQKAVLGFPLIVKFEKLEIFKTEGVVADWTLVSR